MSVTIASQFTRRDYTGNWAGWKTVQASKGGQYQYDDDDSVLTTVWFYDGPEVHVVQMWDGTVPDGIQNPGGNIGSGYTQTQNNADLSDFTTNFKPTANAVIAPKAVDGRVIAKDSTANRCKNFKLRAFSFYTSTGQSGVHNVSPLTNADYGDVTVTMYDVTGAVTALPALSVKEHIDFMPAYNYEIIGGFVDTPVALVNGVTDQWFISAVAVPDLPPQAFGSVDFVSEVNIEAIAGSQGRIHSDGRAVNYLPYNYGGYPTNKLRLTIKHPVGVAQRFQVYIEHFV